MTGKKIVDMAILGVSTLITLAVLGVFVFTEIIDEKKLPENTIEKEEMIATTKDKVAADYFKVDKIIINLNTPGSRLRFLDIEMHLVPFKKKYNDVFEKSKPFINDTVIDVASNMNAEELNSIAGKMLLENRIRKRLNEFYDRQLVKEIFFSRFVVQ